jgi:hypothetical protein
MATSDSRPRLLLLDSTLGVGMVIFAPRDGRVSGAPPTIRLRRNMLVLI